MDILKIRKKAKELKEKREREREQFSLQETTVSPVEKVEQKSTPQEIHQDLTSVEEVRREGERIPETPSPSEVALSVPATEPQGSEATEEGLEEERIYIEVPQIEVLEFVLGEEEYGVVLQDVREIIRMKPITEVPRSPSFVKGILSLRGTMIPVIDLKQRLKLGETTVTPATRIIITAEETRYIGVIVDRINGVVKIREDGIEPTPPTISPDVAEFIKGLGKYSDRIVRLLDLVKVSQFELR